MFSMPSDTKTTNALSIVILPASEGRNRWISHGMPQNAAAAYNMGEHRMVKTMRARFGRESGRDRDYYRVWDRLPGETRDYVPAIIALKRIGRDPKKYGF